MVIGLQVCKDHTLNIWAGAQVLFDEVLESNVLGPHMLTVDQSLV